LKSVATQPPEPLTVPHTEITKRTQSRFRPVLHKGCHLAYQIQGTGPPVVLIHGAGVHGGAWAPQISALAPHYECLWFDNRGLGRSQPLGTRLTLEQMAEDTLALMDAQGWASAHLVGHSMGGLIALHAALSARERVRSLSLLCSFPHGRDATRLTPWMMWTGLRTRIGTRPQRRKAFLEIVMPPSALREANHVTLASELAPLFGHDLADQPPVVMKQLPAMVRYNATPRLHELAGLPTLVVSAEHDRIAPVAIGKAMAAAIPGARFVEIPDASHGASLQYPDRINALLLHHLREN
jgi:pimeloyl-ACP methyl ester carboxylesterase